MIPAFSRSTFRVVRRNKVGKNRGVERNPNKSGVLIFFFSKWPGFGKKKIEEKMNRFVALVFFPACGKIGNLPGMYIRSDFLISGCGSFCDHSRACVSL